MIYHHTYSFDPHKFHRDLEAQIVVDSRILLDKLHHMAANVAQHATDITQQVFDDIRFDVEWVTGDLSEPNRWYMLMLAEVLKPSPNLSIMSRNVLRRVMPLIGWNSFQITLLLLGKDLSTLPSSDSNPLFGAQFAGIRQFGSWLSQEDLLTLSLAWENSRVSFAPAPKGLLEAIEDYAQFMGSSTEQLLEVAYDNARIMLETPLKEGQALFISSD